MSFHVPPLFLAEVLKLTTSDVEGFPDGDGRSFRLVGCPVKARLVLHDDLVARNGDVNADVDRVSGPMMPVRDFYENPTTHDAGIERLEVRGLLTNQRFKRRRGRRVAERDLHRNLHDVASMPWTRGRRPGRTRFSLNNATVVRMMACRLMR